MAWFGDKKATPEEGEKPQKAGFFDRLKKAVQNTKTNLVTRIEDVVKGKKEISPEMLDELEGSLIQADIGMAATTQVLENVRAQISRKLINDAEALRNQIKQELLAILKACPQGGVTPFTPGAPKPWVSLVVG